MMSTTLKSSSFYKNVKKGPLTAARKSQIIAEDTRRKRGLIHLNFRNIQESPEVEAPVAEPVAVIKDRKMCLKQWKEEKERKLAEEKKKKKPAFKAGVVSHSIGSPYFHVYSDSKKTLKPLHKQHKFQFRLANAKVLPKLTIPVAPKFTERKLHCKTNLPDENRRVLRSNATKENILPVVNQPVKNLRSKTVDPLQVKILKTQATKILNAKVTPLSPKNVLNNISNVAEQTLNRDMVFSPFSPNVCVTRGKRRPPVRSSGEDDEEEKEKKKARRQRTRIATAHFQRIDHETERLHGLCNDWNKVAKEERLPEDIISEIDALNGKTRLLTSDKFMQFRKLVEDFDLGNSTPAITSDDLTGFWEMAYLQVEDLDKKFNKLDELKRNGWKDTKPKANQPKKMTNKPPAKVLKKPAASSSLRNFIAAARQNKEKTVLPNQELKVFDAVAFRVVSPVAKSPLPSKSDANTSLLRQVLSSNSKRNSSRFSAINAMNKSTLARSFTSSPAVIMNQEEATPKSILRKSTGVANRKKSLRFGPPMFQSPISAPNSDSSFDHSSMSATPKQKKQKKKAGTPYKPAALDETFSMDEDEENESPASKPQTNEAMATPVRSSRSRQDQSRVSLAFESARETTTPLRRSVRLSRKSSECLTPVSSLF